MHALTLPDDSSIHAPGLLSYDQRVRLDESDPEQRVVLVTRNFQLHDRRIERADYATFREVLRAIHQADDRTLSIRMSGEGEGQ